MPTDPRLRPALTWTTLAIAVALFAWAGLLLLTGGLDTSVLGLHIRTHDPLRPLFGASLALSTFLLAGGRTPRWILAGARVLQSVPGRLEALDRVTHHGRRATLIGGSLSVVVAVLLAFTRPRVLPSHDTLQVFEVFYFFYSHLLAFGEAPRWVPYGAFGTPFETWSILAVTPLGYLAAGVGWALQWKDALSVFTLSVAFELLVFAFGMAALLRRLSVRPAVTWIAVIGMMLSISWSTQIWWNFRILYGLPLVLFFVARFFERGHLSDLCLAGLCEAATLIGGLSYFAPFHVLVVTVAGLGLWINYRATFHLARPRRWWTVAVLTAWTAASLGGWLWVTIHTMRPLVPPAGHLPGDMSVPLDIYLTWAVNGSLGDTLKMMARGWPLFVQAYPDNSLYLGAFTIFFLLWGVLYNRHTFGFRLLAGLALFVLWLSFAGLFALVMYHAPGFRMFRHLGLLLSTAGIFAFAAATWGIEHFVRHARARHLWWLLVALWCLSDAASDPGQTLNYYRWWQGAALTGSEAQQLLRLAMGCGVILFVLMMLSRGRRVPWQERVGGLSWLVVLAWIVDLALFGHFRIAQLPTITAAEATASQPFLDARTPQLAERVRSEDGAHQIAVLIAQTWKTLDPLKTTNYGSGDMWRLRDGCRHIGVETFVLETTRQAFVASETNASPLLSAVFQCETPKLRLLPASALGADDREPLPPSAGDVTVEAFSANHVSVMTRADSAGVLFYADAAFPDWHAVVDGRTETIVPAFGAFKAVPVPAGVHHVEFRFVPAWRVTATECVTLSAAIFLLALFGAGLKRALTSAP